MSQKQIFLDGEGDNWFKSNLNNHHHKPKVLTHKMDFSKMFTWSKNYFIRFKQVFNHKNFLNDIYDEDSRVSINILLKKNDIYRK